MNIDGTTKEKYHGTKAVFIRIVGRRGELLKHGTYNLWSLLDTRMKTLLCKALANLSSVLSSV